MNASFLEEYRALREATGVIDRSARGRLAAAGRDRLTYLHAMLTNDVASLSAGKGCYAAYLTAQGRMLADMRVLELGDLTLLDVEPDSTALVLEKLEQFIFSEDVQLSNLSEELGEICVCGPGSAEMLSGVLNAAAGVLAALQEYQSIRVLFDGGNVVAAAEGEFGTPAFNVDLARPHAGPLRDALRRAGAVDASVEAAEILRVEAGRPRYGVDMDETTIPLEAGIEARAISFTKGCYPGQEVITRVLQRGHGRVAKRLVGVACESDHVPVHGDLVVAGDREIGRVTSATFSPSLEVPIALGYLHRDFVNPGTAVAVVHDDARIAAHVVTLPFVASR